MKISKGLKELKKLKNKASTLSSKIQRHNKTMSLNTPQYSMTELIKEYHETLDTILTIKTQIMEANVASGNYKAILRISELKGLLRAFGSVDTEGGFDERTMYSTEKIEYKVQIDTKQMEVLKKEIEEEIETILDTLDEFNAKTSIEYKVEAKA